MNKELKKLTLNAEKAPISWEKQRSDINKKIEGLSASRRSRILTHRWVYVAALLVICLLGGWFLIHQTTPTKEELASVEIIEFEETLPEALAVLDGFDVEESEYDELIEFMVPNNN